MDDDSKMRILQTVAVLVLLAIPRVTAGAQQRPHLVRGLVTTDSGAAVPGADVTVTVAPSTETFVGKTDATGAYRVTILPAAATGEYLLYVGALGRRAFRRRVTIGPADSLAVVDVKLAPAVVAIGAIRVQAQRPRPPRSLGIDAPTSGTDGLNRQVDGVANALGHELQGNFDAMASLVPGLAVSSNGVSAFGLGADANMTTLNGIPFSGAGVPKGLATTTTYLTSPWDPTRGGFSGALASTTVRRGANIATRHGGITFDSPALQTGDAMAERFGQKFTNVQLNDVRSGPISLDKYFYSVGLQASRRVASVASLLDLDPGALALAGIAADSVFRLTQLLAAQQIPVTRGDIPSHRATTSAQFLGRFDRALPLPRPGVAPEPAWNILVGADYTRATAFSLSPTVLPLSTGQTTTGGALVQGTYSTNFGAFGDDVNETATGFSYRDSRTSPYLSLPGGNVLIVSTTADGAPAIGALNFGGNGQLARNATSWAWEVSNQTSFLVHHLQALPAKVYLQSRYEHFNQASAVNRLGTFNFASLDALASGRPSTYSRTLNPPDAAGGQWIGAAAFGGNWVTPHLTLAGGARVDANVFTGRPQLNPALESTFAVRNDRAPNSVSVSPRLGFTWYPTADRGVGTANTQVSSTVRGGYSVRGGVGQFRSFLPTSLLASAISATGLPGSTHQLICTGAAVPAADWPAYQRDPSTIPTSCVGGASVFADTAPNALLVDPSLRPSRVWRATLGWTNTLLGNYVAVDAAYSLNLDQPGLVDLNFAGLSRFTLPAEGNRPVFVSPSSIVPATGSVAASESRKSGAFGPVLDRVSDLRGDARQLTIYAIPNIPFRVGFVTVGYTYSVVKSQLRGFDGSAAGDPRTVEWASAAFTPRHQFVVQGARLFGGGNIALSVFARVMSGLRYTPVVDGDVNGDGLWSDRAFVFDPARTADTSLARGLREILTSGSSSARTCLSSQVNRLAERSSCVGPWAATMNVNLMMLNVPGTKQQVHASLNFTNPLAGLDQLLHGSGNLHGWGSAALVDGTLYRVRRFDPGVPGFVYDVNPRFGSTNSATGAFRTPFRVTLDVQIDYGHSAEEQRLGIALRIKPPLVGTRASTDTIKLRYMRSGYTDPYQMILRFADSLALSRAQSEQLQAHQQVLLARADSIYTALAGYLAALPEEYDLSDALRHVTEANDAAWKLNYAEVPFLRQLLTSGQIRLLFEPVREMMMTPNYTGRFFSLGPA